MMRILSAFLSFVVATAAAQQQESEMLRRILEPPGEGDVSDLQDVSYATSASFESSSYATREFSEAKEADTSTFATRSFLGIKNPWFGKSVIETPSASLADKTATAGEETYGTSEFVTGSATRVDQDAEIRDVVPTARAVTLEQMTRDGDLGVSQFTQNLEKDLSIDEVRELLNKAR